MCEVQGLAECRVQVSRVPFARSGEFRGALHTVRSAEFMRALCTKCRGVDYHVMPHPSLHMHLPCPCCCRAAERKVVLVNTEAFCVHK